MQPRPLAQPLDPDRLRTVIADLLAGAGLRRVHGAVHSGAPAEPRVHSAKTHVPFLMLCLEGRFDAQVFAGAGAMRALTVPAGEAIWYPAQRWVDVFHYRCRHYLRITFDHDHTLFGLKDTRRGSPPALRGELRTWAVAQARTKVFDALLARLDQVGELAADHARSLMSAVLAEALALAERAPSTGGEATWLAVRDWCARHWQEAIGRAEVARAVGISPTHVSRLFARHGSGLRAHLTALRLGHACDLLRDTDLPLAAIAERCAFANASHLVRAFRAEYGQPPGRWRAERRRATSAGA